MSNIVHMCTTAHGTARGCFFFFFFFFFFFLHNRLVRIIEGPDNRGPDNRGSTVEGYDETRVMRHISYSPVTNKNTISLLQNANLCYG